MKKNFTLIELLAVIFIILLLMGLAARGIPMAMERGRMSKCGGNLRDIGFAVASFGSDNEAFPFGSTIPDPEDSKKTINVATGAQLAEALKPYIKFVDATTGAPVATGGNMADLWYCPSATKVVGTSSYRVRTDTIAPNAMDADCPIVADKSINHKNTERANILFGTGSVRSYSKVQADKITDNTAPATWEADQ